MQVSRMTFLAALVLSLCGLAEGFEELQVKRQEVFEFAEKPAVTRQGDLFTITFASKGYCDATVAIEDGDGRIVRHLASGVLGANAPAPFAKDSLKQSITWDGKDDQGRYPVSRDGFVVRVSLGLNARFERTLFHSAHKRVGRANRPLIAPAPDGVYVFEGEGVDILRLYDHAGGYVRTIYPFPSGKLDEVQGLDWREFPQSGRKLPVKGGLKHYATLLTGGTNMLKAPGKYGAAASSIAVHGQRIGLASILLNRLSTDGATPPGLKLTGGQTSVQARIRREGSEPVIVPRSAAFSPDGKTLYVTGFQWSPGWPEPPGWLNGVGRINFDSDQAMEAFVGSLAEADATKTDGPLKAPSSVAVDSAGRVYVGDYMNDRVAVFSSDGKLFKSISVPKPAQVAVHHMTGEIYVFSYYLLNRWIKNEDRIPATFYRLGPVDDPKIRFSCPLPLHGYSERSGLRWSGYHYSMAVDTHTDPVTIWQVPGTPGTTEMLELMRGKMGSAQTAAQAHIRLLVEKDGKLEVIRDFGKDVIDSVLRTMPPVISRQRLFVDPTTGLLYVAEGDSGVMKSFHELVEIDPASGRVRHVQLPMTAEDMAFGIDGSIYLRTDTEIMRFDPKNWREIPWDYGEERPRVGFDVAVKGSPAVAALVLPAQNRPAYWHQGGMWVSARGQLAVATYNVGEVSARGEFSVDGGLASRWASRPGRKYAPPQYPGRVKYGEIHVFDAHGKIVHEDAIPGLAAIDGLAIDNNGDLYVMPSASRVIDGKTWFLPWTSTLFKVSPGKCRLVSGSDRAPIPLARGDWPKNSPHMTSYATGPVWIEGCHWVYGGVGFGNQTGGCVCWNSRFAIDYFARVFVPEIDHFTVAVLDSSGNVICRLGQYGNVDDGQIALFHAAYVATHSDRRLFIADAGNRRLLGVRLDYAADERVPLGN